MRQIDHFISGGGAVARQSEVFDPIAGASLARVALGDAAMFDKAVAPAQLAGPAWATKPNGMRE